VPTQVLHRGGHYRDPDAGGDEAKRGLQFPHLTHGSRLDAMAPQYFEQLIGVAWPGLIGIEYQKLVRSDVETNWLTGGRRKPVKGGEGHQ